MTGSIIAFIGTVLVLIGLADVHYSSKGHENGCSGLAFFIIGSAMVIGGFFIAVKLS